MVYMYEGMTIAGTLLIGGFIGAFLVWWLVGGHDDDNTAH